VGKWTVVSGVLSERFPTSLMALADARIEDLRDAAAWLDLAPLDGLKVLAVDLDSARDPMRAQSVLLKPVEQMPRWGRFVGVTSNPDSFPALVSRCHVIRFGLLAREEMARVLVSAGVPLSSATELSRLASSVSEALKVSGAAAARSDVMAFLEAVVRADRGSVLVLADSWTQDHRAILDRWVVDSVAGFSRFFKDSEMSVGDRLDRRGLKALADGCRAGLPPEVLMDLVLA